MIDLTASKKKKCTRCRLEKRITQRIALSKEIRPDSSSSRHGMQEKQALKESVASRICSVNVDDPVTPNLGSFCFCCMLEYLHGLAKAYLLFLDSTPHSTAGIGWHLLGFCCTAKLPAAMCVEHARASRKRKHDVRTHGDTHLSPQFVYTGCHYRNFLCILSSVLLDTDLELLLCGGEFKTAWNRVQVMPAAL